MGKEVPYSDEYICDNCGKPGASDFMGDYYCDDCLIVDAEGCIVGLKVIGEQNGQNENDQDS